MNLFPFLVAAVVVAAVFGVLAIFRLCGACFCRVKSKRPGCFCPCHPR